MTPIHIIVCACAVLAVSLLDATSTRSADGVPVLTMSSPRAAHEAVSLNDGRVALVGGCVVDGCEGGPGSRTVDIFDPRTNRLRQGGTLVVGRQGVAAVAISGGRILIVGGWSGRRITASLEIFDPRTGTSAEVATLRTPRADVALATLRDGRVAIVGGYDGQGAVGDVELFDPATRRLTRAPSLSTPRAGAEALTLSDGRVLVVGGAETSLSGLVPSGVGEIADAALTKWAATGRLSRARYKHAAVALAGGGALVIGGSDARDRQGKILTVEVFEGSRNRFVPGGRTLRPRFKISSAVVLLADGRVFIGGGAEQPEIYDPRTEQSALVDVSLGAVRSFATASLLADGRVLIAGGYEENTIAVSRGLWLVRP